MVALAGNLDETHRMMVKIFEDEVTGTFPMTETTPQMQSQLSQFFEQYRRYDTMGGTDIEAALTSAAQEYVPEGRSAAVILLSDGESDVDVNSVAQTTMPWESLSTAWDFPETVSPAASCWI